jgi:hypothetical protein
MIAELGGCATHGSMSGSSRARLLIGVFPLRFETAGAVVGALGGLAVHGLGVQELIGYRANIEAVDIEAVASAAITCTLMTPDRARRRRRRVRASGRPVWPIVIGDFAAVESARPTVGGTRTVDATREPARRRRRGPRYRRTRWRRRSGIEPPETFPHSTSQGEKPVADRFPGRRTNAHHVKRNREPPRRSPCSPSPGPRSRLTADGSGGGDRGAGQRVAEPNATAEPTGTAEPTETAEPSEAAEAERDRRADRDRRAG